MGANPPCLEVNRVLFRNFVFWVRDCGLGISKRDDAEKNEFVLLEQKPDYVWAFVVFNKRDSRRESTNSDEIYNK